jgi:16S rRNA (adenine1518-N6/adenine1519-N6)-dimethyltransferase
VERLFTLPPGAFSPPPKVHSSVVRLTMSPRVNALNVDEEGFIHFLKRSFGQKRKTLWNNLKTEYAPDLLKEALREAGVKPTVRAETLPLEKSAAIFRALASRNGNLPSGKK